MDREWCREGVEGGEATSILFALKLGFLRSKFRCLCMSESRGEFGPLFVCIRDGDESARSGFARARFEASDSDGVEMSEEELWPEWFMSLWRSRRVDGTTLALPPSEDLREADGDLEDACTRCADKLTSRASRADSDGTGTREADFLDFVLYESDLCLGRVIEEDEGDGSRAERTLLVGGIGTGRVEDLADSSVLDPCVLFEDDEWDTLDEEGGMS